MTSPDRASFVPAELLALVEQAAAAEPDDVVAVRNLGIMLNRMGRAGAAEATLRRALALDPADGSTEYALAQNLLGQGRFAEGWPLYAARGRAAGPHRSGMSGVPDLPRWTGQPLAGRALTVLPEQGLGDQIQLVRFLLPVLAAGAAVTLVTNPALHALFRTSFPAATVIPAAGAVKLPACDYWISLGDLPVVLDALPERWPVPLYLRTDQRWSAPPAGVKIGAITSGSPAHLNDRFRSLSAPATADLIARLPGTVIDLHPDASGISDFAQTAALINEMDAVVAVDTSVAHLAGALGKPCFLLLPGFNTDWRWMRGRSDSPWYPQHRLYRGLEDGTWGDAIERLVSDVQDFCSTKGTVGSES